MLKHRLVAVLPILDGRVVQSLGFRRHLPLGSPDICVEYLNRWGIDEIVLLDIGATRGNREPDFALVERVSEKCFVPLAAGGGVQSVADMRTLIRNGADKIVVNTAAWKRPELILEAAQVFGRQCIVVSADVRRHGDGRYEVMAGCGRIPTGMDPAAWAVRAQDMGAGEFLLNSVDRDGAKTGYDVGLIAKVTSAVSIPVVACGGVGRSGDFAPAFKEGGASGAAAANFFQFTEHSVNVAKAMLRREGIPIRGDLYADYAGTGFDVLGRAAKKDDAVLEKMRFQFHPKEII